MKIKIRNPFAKSKTEDENKSDIENVIEQDTSSGSTIQERPPAPSQDYETETVKEQKKKLSPAIGFSRKKKEGKKPKEKKTEEELEAEIPARSVLQKFAYNTLSKRLPGFTDFRDSYGQSGIPVIFEAYISYGFLLSGIAAIPAFAISLLLEIKLFPRAPLIFSIIGSLVLAAIVLGVTFVLWLAYPLLKRRTYKSKLENQLAYSFGILGVLASAGMNMDRLFERIATSESNPVLADLARRFLRNVRVFGLDTETALAEVAEHAPSEAFAKMLGSMAVAQKTTGSIHDLVMFESTRLLQEKKDKLHKTTGSLAVMAELYITLVVVGPIIFIVMMAIFGLLPSSNLPPPILIINLIVFLGIPVLSVMFVLLLDSVVSKA
jgi:archaeal flagellar protein FlaJ